MCVDYRFSPNVAFIGLKACRETRNQRTVAEEYSAKIVIAGIVKKDFLKTKQIQLQAMEAGQYLNV